MNVIVGQSGGPTAVINASLAGVYEAAKKAGVGTVYGMKNGITGVLEDNLVDLDVVFDTPEKLELLKRTPSSCLGSCRYKLKSAEENPADYERIFSVLEKREIDCFFYIGGNDSMDTISKLSTYGKKIGSNVRFVGIPKTIDNDLMDTDHSPGYGSAAKFVATTLKEVIQDAMVYDMKSLLIVEIMGRNAGWLAASSALAKGGSGDVLAGVIASLLAQGHTAFDAACIGVYAHGLAGEQLASRLGARGVLPSDLPMEIGRILG